MCVCVGTELEKTSLDFLVCKIEMGISSASLSPGSVPSFNLVLGRTTAHSGGWNSQRGQQRALACHGDCPRLGHDEWGADATATSALDSEEQDVGFGSIPLSGEQSRCLGPWVSSAFSHHSL